MASETPIGEEWPDVPLEFHRRGFLAESRRAETEDENTENHGVILGVQLAPRDDRLVRFRPPTSKAGNFTRNSQGVLWQ